MKNKETILKDWNKNGYVNIPFFTEEEISDIRKEVFKAFEKSTTNYPFGKSYRFGPIKKNKEIFLWF